MKWVKKDNTMKLPVKSWCINVEPGALDQAVDLSNHPAVINHVALMPDCHQGYGMPIGGVIICKNAVIPNAVGVDIGCGMGAIETDFISDNIKDMRQIRGLMDYLKNRIPVGEGNSHKFAKEWNGFNQYLQSLGLDHPLMDFSQKKLPGWLDSRAWELAQYNLGTLGGGNHFIELQKSDAGYVWLMLHSGSRNLGHRIATFYNKLALDLNEKWKTPLPNKNLAFLPADSREGKEYLRDMNFALSYARENRRRMMEIFKEAVQMTFSHVSFRQEINIHHNYAAIENHFRQNVWIHRKGATSAKKDEMGIIPGSMGTASYIVRGKGNPESFMSCSHGAGRKMSRTAACENLSVKDCNDAMQGIVFDRWHTVKSRYGRKKKKGQMDLSEAPPAYKSIDAVIESELDLIDPVVKLIPLGVVKG